MPTRIWLAAGMLAALLTATPIQAQVTANCSLVGIGSIQHGARVTINCGDEGLTEQIQDLVNTVALLRQTDFAAALDLINELSSQLSFTQGRIESALRDIGEANIAPGQRVDRLLDILSQQQQTIDELRASVSGEDAALDALRERAATAIEAGELDRADEI